MIRWSNFYCAEMPTFDRSIYVLIRFTRTQILILSTLIYWWMYNLKFIHRSQARGKFKTRYVKYKGRHQTNESIWTSHRSLELSPRESAWECLWTYKNVALNRYLYFSVTEMIMLPFYVKMPTRRNVCLGFFLGEAGVFLFNRSKPHWFGSFVLAHLSQRLKWAFLIKICHCPSSL